MPVLAAVSDCALPDLGRAGAPLTLARGQRCLALTVPVLVGGIAMVAMNLPAERVRRRRYREAHQAAQAVGRAQ